MMGFSKPIPSPPLDLLATLRATLTCLEQADDPDSIDFRKSLAERIAKLEAAASQQLPANL